MSIIIAGYILTIRVYALIINQSSGTDRLEGCAGAVACDRLVEDASDRTGRTPGGA